MIDRDRIDDLNRPALGHGRGRRDLEMVVETLRRLWVGRRDGGALDPLAIFCAIGYRARTIEERGTGAAATGL